MMTLDLPTGLEKRFYKYVAEHGLNAEQFLAEIVETFLQDIEDEEVANQRLNTPAKRWTLEQMENNADVEG